MTDDKRPHDLIVRETFYSNRDLKFHTGDRFRLVRPATEDDVISLDEIGMWWIIFEDDPDEMEVAAYPDEIFYTDAPEATP